MVADFGHHLKVVLGLTLIPASLLGQDLALDQLPAMCPYEAHRVTSADPTGGNDDWRYLEPGGTLVLAEIKGPG
jgi:hypothetical protein